MQISKLKLKNKIFGSGFIFLFSIFFFLLSSSAVFAAEYSIISASDKVAVGKDIKTDIVINAGTDLLNAYSVKIDYPADLLSVKEVRDANSIITFWVERPTVSPDKGQIFFSGITPGGYNNVFGQLLSVVFEAKKEGEGRVYFEEAEALLNDGLGTKVDIQKNEFKFSVLGGDAESPIVQEILDLDLPDRFTPVIAKDKNIFNGQWFLVFATQDRGSGIDHYEVREDNGSISPWTGDWATAQSPYLLTDQTLKSRIFVKATDRSGNERIEVLEPQNETHWYENYSIWGIIIAAMFLLFFAGMLAKNKYIVRKKTNA
jgi:hypothetical protein